MNRPVFAILLLLSGSILLNCGEVHTASTEVENEIASVQGLSATGAPMIGGRLSILSEQGEVLGETTSDSSGKFSFTIRNVSDDKYLIYLDSMDFWSVVFMETSEKGKSGFVLVNPLSDWVVRSLLDLSQGVNASFAEEWKRYDTMMWNAQADSLLKHFSGGALTWMQVGYDTSFVPSGGGRVPSSLDVLIHTMTEKASETEQGFPEYLDSINNLGSSFMTDDFQQELLHNGESLGAQSDSLESFVDKWKTPANNSDLPFGEDNSQKQNMSSSSSQPSLETDNPMSEGIPFSSFTNFGKP